MNGVKALVCFFQAEDGIRDIGVTGVQTCALPIYTGIPLMRAMLLEFPDDPTCDYLDRQYMLGKSLLIAPVFSGDGAVTYYLPTGRWTSFLTGEVVEGPRWVRETHDAMSLPLMVRPGSVIAVGSRDDRPDYDFAEGVTLRAYELAEGQQTTTIIPSLTGGAGAAVEGSRSGGAPRRAGAGG